MSYQLIFLGLAAPFVSLLTMAGGSRSDGEEETLSASERDDLLKLTDNWPRDWAEIDGDAPLPSDGDAQAKDGGSKKAAGGGSKKKAKADDDRDDASEDDATDSGGGGAKADKAPSKPVEAPAVPKRPEQADKGDDQEGKDADGSGKGGADGRDDPISIGAGSRIEVTEGRVATLEVEGDVASVEILSKPDHGNVTVNPDNSLALVLTGEDYRGNLDFSYEVTYANGSTETVTQGLKVTKGDHDNGWGTGDHYMLETDANGDLVIEHGDNHRAVHVSKSDDALSFEDIAAMEGIKTSEVTTKWLLAHEEYGADESMALKPDVAEALWKGLTTDDAEPGSHWLLFERGYTYDEADMGKVVHIGTTGESELHPIVVGAYGEGTRPILDINVKLTKSGAENVVFEGVHFTDNVTALNGSNIMFSDVGISEHEVNIQNVDNLTLRGVDLFDAVDEAPSGKEWYGHADRESGIFIKNTDGVLIEHSFFDHNGWEADYAYDRDGDAGQAPSMFSHNVYIQKDSLDVTFRDNITMRGASFGAQIRPGGLIEDNVFLDNNAGVNFLGGGKKGDSFPGQYSLFTDNVVTSAAHKTVDHSQGAVSLGVNGNSNSTLLDNIVAHLADPNDPSDLAAKELAQKGLTMAGDAYYDDTIVYNWVGTKHFDQFEARNQNASDLDYGKLDQTTIQIFAQDLLNDPNASIDDLALYLRDQYADRSDTDLEADDIVWFFQEGFDISEEIRDDDEILRFVPDELGEGVRWDNRLNWDTEDLPGTVAGDSVDLGGNWVNYGGTTRIDDLDFGDGGRLTVNQGKLTVTGEMRGDDAQLKIDDAGQVHVATYGDADRLDIDIDGGRFANTGIFAGATDMDVTDGQAILAGGGADFVLRGGSDLTIVGDDAKVGFDGAGGKKAGLFFEEGSTLRFEADQDGFATISEFHSGQYDADSPQVASTIGIDGGVLQLDVTAIAKKGYDGALMESDNLMGAFDEIEIVGLRSDQDARLLYDYESDTLNLKIGRPGTGDGSFEAEVVGDEGDAGAALMAALTSNSGVLSETEFEPNPDTEPFDMMM